MSDLAIDLTLAPEQPAGLAPFTHGYHSHAVGGSRIIHADCFAWFAGLPDQCLHAVVTDPPYGVKEYDAHQLEKRAIGRGGVWRIPPSFDGHTRSPLPRFTALNQKERDLLREFFTEWAALVARVLRPGGHVFLASNSFLSQLVFAALVDGGLEFRGELIRVVQTLRGGDRPKNFDEEFSGVSSMPRGCYEPWGIFRRPLPPGMTVGECLREFQTGGLRRPSRERPFSDLIFSTRTSQRERALAPHPSLKPQAFLRQVVHAALPLGEGVVVDPFMGSGSTVAAGEAIGVRCIGVERYGEYFELSRVAIPKLAALHLDRDDSEQPELPI